MSLEVVDLHVSRGGATVVRGASMEVQAGSVTTLLGPNGAGKSTLVLAVGGVLRAASGRVLIDGHAVSRSRPEVIRRAGLAIVPEGHRTLVELSVRENLRVAAAGLRRAAVADSIRETLETFAELRPKLDARAGTLSGGQQQMVALAQAMLARPRYLIIDELSLGLAPVIVRRLIPTLQRIAATGVGVLLIEQFTGVALELASKAYVLEGGQIRFEGPASLLVEDPGLLHAAYFAA